MATVSIEINGQKIKADSEKTILEIVGENNLDKIPTLCHSPELKPYGSCFLCVVEVAGRPNLLPACATRVAEGMSITTRSERINKSRRTALEFLMSNHYADCVSPCAAACPAGVDCQGYVALAAMGHYPQALRVIREMNPLPAVCGRVCVRKCEIECRRSDIDEPVGINNIKRFVSDSPGAYDDAPARMPSRGKSVGIVGAGPAGLTAAWYLGIKGYDPVIYEAMPKAGGMLRYGIPEYRLPKDVIDKEIEYIKRAGCEIKTDVNVGKNITLDGLMKKHAAVFVAAGAMGSKGMGVKGEETTAGVMKGVDFLILKTENRESMKGIIVVVGGGNTAIDVARTSWRLGADRVIVLYRRTKAEMPADKLEIEDCLKEGIEIMELAAPVGIESENGRLKALKCIRMKLGEPDSSGRRKPVPQEGSEFVLPCDIAVSAIGQEPVLTGLIGGECSPKTTKWNTIASDPVTMRTNVEGLYAGGDAADDGPTVVVDAVRDGRRAAQSIHEYLSGEKPQDKPFAVSKSFWAKPGSPELGEIKEAVRREAHEISIDERRGNFSEVSKGYEYEDLAHECGRCLSCGCIVYDRCDLRLYAGEYGVDMTRFAGYVRKHKIDDRHPYVVYDPNKCILCARCIRTCERVLPISALGLVGRGFKTEMRPAMNDPLSETNCISCGNCVSACPTGALTVKFPFPGRACLPTEDISTHCAFCSIGCGLTVKRTGNRYYTAPAEGPGNYLCRYGRFGTELFTAMRRIADPMALEQGRHKNIAVSEACAKTAAALKKTAEKYGPASVGVFVSPELSNEEMYLAARIAREGIGTNNISSLSLLCADTDSGALDGSLGFTASTSGMESLDTADLVVCNNTDTQNEHLILSVQIIKAVRAGAKLIISGSTGDSMAGSAKIRFDPMRGRSALLWNGVIQVLLDRGFFDRGGVKKLQGGDKFLSDIFDYTASSISDVTGVEERKIKEAADLISASKKIVFVHCPDRSLDRSPGDITVLANLLILLRSKGIEADIILPYTGANGAAMEVTGADPKFCPGRLPSGAMPGAGGRRELFNMLKEGKIKAALIIGEDPMRDDKTASYFGNIEFLAAADWCVTETTLAADIVLPCSTFFESDGKRINFESALIRYTKAVEPLCGIPSWKMLAGLAEAFAIKDIGKSFDAVSSGLDAVVRAGVGDFAKFYWNTGQKRGKSAVQQLKVADVRTKPSPVSPPLTISGYYKRRIIDVGRHFRVQSLRV